MSKPGSYFNGSSVLKNQWKSIYPFLKLPFTQTSVKPRCPWAVIPQNAFNTNEDRIYHRIKKLYNDILSYKKTQEFYKTLTLPQEPPLPPKLQNISKLEDRKYYVDDQPIIDKIREHFEDLIPKITTYIKTKSKNSFIQNEEKTAPITNMNNDKSWILTINDLKAKYMGNSKVLVPLLTKIFGNKYVVIITKVTDAKKPINLKKKAIEKSYLFPLFNILEEKDLRLDSSTNYRLKDGKMNYFNADRLNLLKPSPFDYDRIQFPTINDGRYEKFAKFYTKDRILDSTYDELCIKSSPNDYLKISRSFDAVIIRNMRNLTQRKLRGENKRFSTLIDTLYNNNVKIVITPEPKVTGVPDVFEFEEDVPRSQTRLIAKVDNFREYSPQHILTGAVNRPITYRKETKIL